MSSVYTPTSVALGNITIPSDGDAFAASSFNGPIQAIADGVEYTTELSESTSTLVTRSVLQLGNITTDGTGGGKVIYSAADQAWWAVGGASAAINTLRNSADRSSWLTTTPPFGVALVDIDLDASGNAVICGLSGTDVLDFTRSGGLWPAGSVASRTVFGGSTSSPSVVHDPVRARWAVLGYDGTAQRAFHSTNRSAWTSTTTTLTGTQRPRAWVNKVSGRIVAVNTNGTSTINVQTSDDGGQTWTARTAVTTVATTVSSSHIDMAYGATDGVWLMTVTNTSSLTEIWRSTDDGSSWALRATLAGGTVVQGSGLAVIGSIWCAIRVLGTTGVGLIYSEDQGLTWRYSGWRPLGTITEAWLAAGDGQLAFSGTVGGVGVLYTSNVRTGRFGVVI